MVGGISTKIGEYCEAYLAYFRILDKRPKTSAYKRLSAYFDFVISVKAIMALLVLVLSLGSFLFFFVFMYFKIFLTVLFVSVVLTLALSYLWKHQHLHFSSILFYLVTVLALGGSVFALFNPDIYSFSVTDSTTLWMMLFVYVLPLLSFVGSFFVRRQWYYILFGLLNFCSLVLAFTLFAFSLYF
jgi:hypothetical protein